MALRVLLDTHALLWWLFDEPQLSRKARNAIRKPDNIVMVSSASAWEIATKFRLGRLPEAAEAANNLAALLRQARFDVLPIALEHASSAGMLGGDHRDPFDRMLIAQAKLEQLPVITRDPIFKAFGVRVIW